jgi:hypothetical protein
MKVLLMFLVRLTDVPLTIKLIHELEHYFEMSHIDAEEALRIYRHFCKQTEKVVEFLGVAKKLQNLLNVPIPNLKHVCSFSFLGYVLLSRAHE